MNEFSGFGPATKKFLSGLGRHNEKTWFDAHRTEYEEYYLEPAKAFVDAVEPKLSKIAPKVVCEPRVNGSIFRVNRDIRFSKDKTPYKDHIDMWFWEGHRKTAVSGFFLRITSKNVILGAGCHGFERSKLASYRKKVADPRSGKRLVSIVSRLNKGDYEVGGKHYKKLPRGFDGSGLTADLLLHSALWASVERKHPAELGSKKFVDYCAREWKKLAPLHEWLTKEV